MKVCRLCNQEKNASEFHIQKGNRDGLNHHCRQCVSEYNRKRYLANRESFHDRYLMNYYSNIEESRRLGRECAKRKRLQNPQKAVAYQQLWRSKNVEKYRELNRNAARARRASGIYKEQDAASILRTRQKKPEKYNNIRKQYALKYPDRVRLAKNNNLSKRRAAPGKLSVKEWKSILLFYGKSCGICGVSETLSPLTIDHYIPITKGGENTWKNVWPLCLTCNLKKRAKMPAELYPPHVSIMEKIDAA